MKLANKGQQVVAIQRSARKLAEIRAENVYLIIDLIRDAAATHFENVLKM